MLKGLWLILVNLKYVRITFPLDVRFNQLKELESVRHVTQLPQLEELTLLGNPCETVLDFRVKILQMFGTLKPFPTLKCQHFMRYWWISKYSLLILYLSGNRAGEICLNNEKAIQKELDTVAVLLALSLAKTQNLKWWRLKFLLWKLLQFFSVTLIIPEETI